MTFLLFITADCPEYVVKAQILAGGRGKGVFDNGFKGGVHLTTKSVLYSVMYVHNIYKQRFLLRS